MKKIIGSIVVGVFWLVVLALILSTQIHATTLSVVENQVTSSYVNEAYPRIGYDGYSHIVVYESYELEWLDPYYYPGQSDIYYHRINGAGVPIGNPVPVSTDPSRFEGLVDTSGDYIVFIESDEWPLSYVGKIMLYQISTGLLQQISIGSYGGHPSIFGETVVWVTGSQIMKYELGWLGTPQQAIPLTDIDPLTEIEWVEIGDRFVVWMEGPYFDENIMAYEMSTNSYFTVDESPSTTLRTSLPVSSGSWVAYNLGPTVNVKNMDTGEIDWNLNDHPFLTPTPRITGDLVLYQRREASVLDTSDIYVSPIASNGAENIPGGS